MHRNHALHDFAPQFSGFLWTTFTKNTSRNSACWIVKKIKNYGESKGFKLKSSKVGMVFVPLNENFEDEVSSEEFFKIKKELSMHYSAYGLFMHRTLSIRRCSKRLFLVYCNSFYVNYRHYFWYFFTKQFINSSWCSLNKKLRIVELTSELSSLSAYVTNCIIVSWSRLLLAWFILVIFKLMKQSSVYWSLLHSQFQQPV